MPKKIPMRTCIGCGAVKPKKELVRIVLTQEGDLVADRTGRMPGRGAYLCDSSSCVRMAVKRKGFARAFRTQVSPESCSRLETEMEKGGMYAG